MTVVVSVVGIVFVDAIVFFLLSLPQQDAGVWSLCFDRDKTGRCDTMSVDAQRLQISYEDQ